MNASQVIRLTRAESGAALDDARLLMREYAAGLGWDLGFQGFDAELATLPGAYGPPRGALLLAHVDGALAGCGGLRPLRQLADPHVGELKRLYVRPACRGLGLGRRLAEALLDDARRLGYRSLLLDTLASMTSARRLYGELGFVEVEPYYDNPLPGARYLRRELRREA